MATRTEPYTGPFPRKRHYHKCVSCARAHRSNGVNCYKSHCTRPQLTEDCLWCRERGDAAEARQLATMQRDSAASIGDSAASVPYVEINTESAYGRTAQLSFSLRLF